MVSGIRIEKSFERAVEHSRMLPSRDTGVIASYSAKIGHRSEPRLHRHRQAALFLVRGKKHGVADPDFADDRERGILALMRPPSRS